MNPMLQSKDINEKQEKMNQVIQELREKLKRDNKLQDSPYYENDDDVSNIPFDEEPTDKSLMNPIHLNAASPAPVPEEEHLTPSTEYGEVIPETPEENLIPRIEYNQVTPEEVPMVNEESKPNCEYLNKIEIPQSHCLEGKEYKKLALKLHPDKNLACSAEANEKFQELENRKCSNEDEEVTQEQQEEVPVPQEYNEVTPEEIPVPQEEVPEVVKEEIPVPQEEKHPVPFSQENQASIAAPVASPIAASIASPHAASITAPIPKNTIEEETKTPTETTDFSLSSLTEPTNTFDQEEEEEEISRMPSSISNSFQNIIDYVSNQIVGKLSNILSGGSDELQNGFIANNLNNRNFGVGGQKSPALTFGKGKTRRNHKKAKKYTRRV
jgi:hypothetical protein